MTTVPEITVAELKARLDAGEEVHLVDVRRPDEHAFANIGGQLIPLGDLPRRLGALEAYREAPMVVVYCRSGARSASAVGLLRQAGFPNVYNLKGGILAWSNEIDPTVPKY